MSDLMLDVGLANELKMSFRRNGWTEGEVKKAAEGDFLAQVRRVLLGNAEIVTPEHVIDCDADPLVPDGWTVEEHQKGGLFKWDRKAQKDALYLSEGQQNGKLIEGNKLRKELMNRAVLNANVLDHLLANTHLIPEEWKGRYVFFWATIFRDRRGLLCVRCLGWYGGGWLWRAGWLGDDWCGGCPAAVPAS